jgi:hypothetical protein
MTICPSASITSGSPAGSGTVEVATEDAGSMIWRVLLVWSWASTVEPLCSTSRSPPSLSTTVLSSNTSVFARPSTWREPLVTQTEASSSSSFCSV